MAIRFDNIELINLLNNQGEQTVALTDDQGISVSGNAAMVTGNSSGKFAVMTSAVHGSYDFYNNGTTYLNGSTIIDAACTINGQLTVNPDSDSQLILGNGGTNASVVFGGSGDDLYLGGGNSSNVRLHQGSSYQSDFYGLVTVDGSFNLVGSSRVIKMNNGGYLDFDGTNLQINTQRDPNTGGFHDTAKSHAHIGLQGVNGGSKIIFGTQSSNNTVATTRMELDKNGHLEMKSTHSYGNFSLYYNHGDTSNSAMLTLWASEPGMTYHSCGIGANVHRSGPYYGRAINSGYGTYIRFHKDNGNITFVNTTSSSGTSGGQGSTKYTFAQNGTFTAVGDVVAYSDAKLKENVKTLEGDKVLQMRGVSFDRKDTGKKGAGVIAQEVQKIAPELVHENEDGTLGVAYGNLTGYLIEAIKQQQETISKLKDRIEKLENK